MRDRQEESDVVQGVPAQEVSGRGHVEERLALRPPIQLVQSPLPGPATAAAPRPPDGPRSDAVAAITATASTATGTAATVVAVFPFHAGEFDPVTAIRALPQDRHVEWRRRW